MTRFKTMKFDKAFVIGSWDFSKNRLNRFYKNIEKHSINVTLWPAIHGKTINIHEYINRSYLPENFEINMPGSLGCLLSHVTLWEHCHNLEDCDIALVLEDDVILDKKFLNILNSISLNELPNDWQIIKLSYNKVYGDEFSKSFIKPKLKIKKGINAGSWCYLINTKEIMNVRNMLIPYDNRKSMDVIIRENIENINMFFLKNKIAYHMKNRYSLRRDLNDINQSFYDKIRFKLKKIFLS
tara:strand:- start:2353 stop:3072 length:720 start_codon:yes stop_codon:yes gene_type:complete